MKSANASNGAHGVKLMQGEYCLGWVRDKHKSLILTALRYYVVRGIVVGCENFL